ncbi:MAG: DUF4340 domain-containing protein [Verrucomicrobiota bacterium]|nr:DUF4340 domain-containing protein [Verrucomicrobiota bacterium]
MKTKTTFRLLLAVCVVGGILAIVERVKRGRPPQPIDQPVLHELAWDQVARLAMATGSNRLDCVREDNAWHIRRPLRVRADEGKVERVLSALQAMRIKEVITPDQRKKRALTLADFGLDHPRARVVVGDSVRTRQVLVGHDAPFGNLVFVKLDPGQNVLAAGPGFHPFLPQDMESFRSRLALPGESARTTRLEIQWPGAGFIQLARKGGDWLIQQSFSGRADSGRIARMLDALYCLKVEKFVWDAPAPPEPAGETLRPPAVPLSEPIGAGGSYSLTPDEAMRITVWTEGSEMSRELLLGKTAGDNGKSVYAKPRDVPSIYLVSRNILDTFSVAVNDLRDRRLFPMDAADVQHICLEKGERKLVLRRPPKKEWTITEPVEWPADEMAVGELARRITALTIQAFADGSETNLATLGLATPACVVQALDRFPEAPAGALPAETPAGVVVAAPTSLDNRLCIGQANSDSTRIYCRFERDPLKFGEGGAVYETAAATVTSLGPDPANPLLYRDRGMLALVSRSVKRLSLIRGKTEQIVVLDEKGAWEAVQPAGGSVKNEVLDDILFLVSNLRACRVEVHNPKDLAAYGLAPPGAQLTLGLSGVEGLQKSVLIGWPAGAQGRFVVIQGQDVVFVLENGVVDRLTRDIVAFQAPGPAAPSPAKAVAGFHP